MLLIAGIYLSIGNLAPIQVKNILLWSKDTQCILIVQQPYSLIWAKSKGAQNFLRWMGTKRLYGAYQMQLNRPKTISYGFRTVWILNFDERKVVHESNRNDLIEFKWNYHAPKLKADHRKYAKINGAQKIFQVHKNKSTWFAMGIRYQLRVTLFYAAFWVFTFIDK